MLENKIPSSEVYYRPKLLFLFFMGLHSYFKTCHILLSLLVVAVVLAIAAQDLCMAKASVSFVVIGTSTGFGFLTCSLPAPQPAT